MKTRTKLATILLGVSALIGASVAGAQQQVGQNLPGPSDKLPGLPQLLWRDPGPVEQIDFAAGPEGPDGAPKPPYSFQEEMGGGTSPKVVIRDSSNRTWEVKWGPETKSESFATRLVWAMGYFVEPAYYVRGGKLENVGALKRAESFVDRTQGNSFTNARFELWDKNTLLTTDKGWFLNDNPFRGKPEFAGLKIMAMLLSNWDLKDPRANDGSNLSTILITKDTNPSEVHYIVNDWGATLGKWGGFFNRSKWDCKGYASETSSFVKGVSHGHVSFGYEGKFTKDIGEGISVSDVAWLMQRLGKVTDEQLRSGLEASGASADEVACYVPAIRSRINQLQRVAAGS